MPPLAAAAAAALPPDAPQRPCWGSSLGPPRDSPLFLSQQALVVGVPARTPGPHRLLGQSRQSAGLLLGRQVDQEVVIDLILGDRDDGGGCSTEEGRGEPTLGFNTPEDGSGGSGDLHGGGSSQWEEAAAGQEKAGASTAAVAPVTRGVSGVLLGQQIAHMDNERKALQKSLDVQQRSMEAMQERVKALTNCVQVLEAEKRELEMTLRAVHVVALQ